MQKFFRTFIFFCAFSVFASSTAYSQAVGVQYVISVKAKREKQIKEWNEKYWQGPPLPQLQLTEEDWLLWWIVFMI